MENRLGPDRERWDRTAMVCTRLLFLAGSPLKKPFMDISFDSANQRHTEELQKSTLEEYKAGRK